MTLQDQIKARQEYKKAFVQGMDCSETSVEWIKKHAVDFAKAMLEDDIEFETSMTKNPTH